MIAPINPIPDQKIPEMKKERTIRILPKIDRATDSCLPMFLVLTTGFDILIAFDAGRNGIDFRVANRAYPLPVKHNLIPPEYGLPHR